MSAGGLDRLAARLGLRPEHEAWMMMSGLVALCALLAVGLLVLPLFGPRVAALTAVGVVLLIFIICYLICIPRVLKADGALHHVTKNTDRGRS